MKFLALNADFSSLSGDPLVSRKPAHASVKEGYPFYKVVISLILAHLA